MSNGQNKQIANTIWQQMRTIDQNLCMCMGVRKLAIIENGLQFEVSGLSFKGLIQITLNGKDLYDVKFIKKSRKLDPVMTELWGKKKFVTTHKVIREFNDVFVDQLMPLLEDSVENRKSA